MDRTHEPLHLDKWSSVHWKIIDIPTSFIWIIIFYVGAFEYGGGSNFWGYVVTNVELLCVDTCTFCVMYIYL
jgi:hypothetical protein